MATQPSPFDQLWLEYHRTGDERVRVRLIEEFRPILVTMAKRVRGELGGQPLMQDLVNAGMTGLLEAFDRFDPDRGVYFETYCAWRVTGAMLDDQRKSDWIAGSLRVKAQRLRVAQDDLTAHLGRPPFDEELCEALGIGHADLAEIRLRGDRPASLNVEGTGLRSRSGDAWPTDPALADERLDPERLALVQEARDLLLRALEALPDKQRYVMLLYYFERLKMADIGRVLELSEARVSQLHKEGLATLLRRLGPRRADFLDALGV